ncbi:fumarylacetoacetate hydrolase family protein [Chelatococcus sp. SYSU_G07232]|uniref:Fumarylacetoacetate hydrolase family protein n=1 Tax=Chelatococcus albus TaxID=3047466 RepID=A0ABT7AI59_9HYPH|nr:fumarylacetoacetate hydrolase family protein [Chelatococcus sp. SYSU_G07232]MDJ1159072.1 fumarylacetoacetate hydrolase family protein [Chelatococcus sp. SYSU_G07232]
MTDYVFAPPALPSVAVAGEARRFPVRRVFCVGRNYAAHAREMGKDPTREPPFFFMKPADAVVPAEGTLPYPPGTRDLHHEVELVAALHRGGRDVPAEKALDLVFGYAVGIDLTRRDLQEEAKRMSRPWDWSKGFDASAPCGPVRPVAAVGHPAAGRIWLAVNGAVRQDGDLSELIWPVADVIAAISRSMELKPGDLVFTGTPAGVGTLQPGDRVTAGVAGVGEIALTIGPA